MSLKDTVGTRAVLVAIAPSGKNVPEVERDLKELERLLETAGGTAVAHLLQIKESPNSNTYLGSGKIEELRELCKNEEADLVVFNDELSPSQIRNIEEELDGPTVCDRSMLILDIFALHAVTSEGKLQVELAQLKYTAPRLRGKGALLSRQEGRIGTRGPGESKLEIDKRYLHRRIAALEADLRELEENRATRRAARERNGIPKITIVGYTNAGKSTLLNALTDAGVLCEDKLFATLDSTTRSLFLPDGKKVLLTDTVGFIRHLPHQLIHAFHSTLEEAMLADVLLLLADVSDPECEEQLSVTKELLSDLGAADIPQLVVYNKCDLAASFSPEAYNFGPNSANRIFISARDGRGVDNLLLAISDMLNRNMHEVSLFLPYTDAGILNLLRDECPFLEEPEYTEDGICVKVLLNDKKYGRFSRFIVGQDKK